MITHTFSEKRAVTQHIEILLEQASQHQPDTTRNKNCTASTLFNNIFPDKWLSIDCDKPYTSYFICSSHTQIQFHKGMFNQVRQLLVDQTKCPIGWTAIYDTCIKLVKIEQMLQITETESMCKRQNASLLNLKEAGYMSIGSVDHWTK